MRRLFIIMVSCVAVLLVGYAGLRGYKVWKNKHLMSLSYDFLAKSDMKNAVLSVKEVLRSDPDNLDATRLMGKLMDASRSPSALLWRSRAVELNPHSLQDRVTLAQTALALRDYASASNALEEVDTADKKTIAFQNMAGVLAAATGRPAEAEIHFLETSRLDPQNPAPQLNLAVVRLHETNEASLVKARTVLQFIASSSTNSALRSQALRELIVDAMRYKHEDAAVALSQQLMQETNSAFTDRLLRLEVLLETRNSDFKPSLAAFQREAAADPAKIFDLTNWEMAKTSPRDALAWLRSLPMNTQTNEPTTFLVAQCYAASKDWPGLHAWLEKQNWAELEFVRHAFMSRALREQELADAAKIEWVQALNSANGQKQGLVMLLRLAAQWNWINEVEQLLSSIFTRYPEEKWAAPVLTRILFMSSQTRLLLDLFNQELKRTPSDLTAKNNLAMVALLLDAKEFKPNDLAREVYQQDPTNSSFAATYAFSLYVQGKSAEALKVMQKIKPQDLDSPSIAGYYGVILKAAGGGSKAKDYFDLASKAALLPEERQLFEQAQARK